MRTTIDAAGRVVIPKAIRGQLGLRGGQSVEIALRDEQIIIEPASVPMRFDPAAGCIVVEPGGAVPTLGTDEVRDVVERVRR